MGVGASQGAGGWLGKVTTGLGIASFAKKIGLDSLGASRAARNAVNKIKVGETPGMEVSACLCELVLEGSFLRQDQEVDGRPVYEMENGGQFLYWMVDEAPGCDENGSGNLTADFEIIAFKGESYCNKNGAATAAVSERNAAAALRQLGGGAAEFEKLQGKKGKYDDDEKENDPLAADRDTDGQKKLHQQRGCWCISDNLGARPGETAEGNWAFCVDEAATPDQIDAGPGFLGDGAGAGAVAGSSADALLGIGNQNSTENKGPRRTRWMTYREGVVGSRTKALTREQRKQREDIEDRFNEGAAAVGIVGLRELGKKGLLPYREDPRLQIRVLQGDAADLLGGEFGEGTQAVDENLAMQLLHSRENTGAIP